MEDEFWFDTISKPPVRASTNWWPWKEIIWSVLYYLLLSATDTNFTFTSGSSFLWLQASQSGTIYHFWSVESTFCTWQPSKLLPRTDSPHAGHTQYLFRVKVWPAKCSQNWSHEGKCFGLADTFEEPVIFLIFISFSKIRVLQCWRPLLTREVLWHLISRKGWQMNAKMPNPRRYACTIAARWWV